MRIGLSRLLPLVAIVSLLLARFVFADSVTSATFRMGQTVNDFGASATSSSFYSISAGDENATGQSTSTSFLLSAGSLYFDTFQPLQQSWRWYDDENSETPIDPLESENVAPSAVQNSNVIKLRVTVSENANIGQDATKFKLQYSDSTDFAIVHEPVEVASCTGTSVWCYDLAGGTDNAVISTNLLTDSDSCAGGVGNGCGVHNTSGISTSTFRHTALTDREYEFTIVPSGAGPNSTYFFRLYDTVANVGVPLKSGATFPSLSTQGSELTFTIDGIASSTLAGGVTTNIDTTSTDIEFGTLPIGVSLNAAQRLTVSTNAPNGYQILVYQPQGFVGSGAQEIEPVLGTNSSPTAWNSGCVSTSTGCYGYHTTESVLNGGSTRFAANDTYAQFSSTPGEVAYSPGPASNESTDMVYRVEARDLTPAGSYAATLIYIALPVF